MQQSRDFSLRGAVDLGARQAAQRRQQQAAARAEGSGDQPAYVIEVTDQSFNTDVAERSRTVPVIMDLWAEWCGPCKQLSPVLEKLAEEAEGAWFLAKVDVDANPELSAALQVQSIPMVVAVIAGQVVDGFLGAQPESSVREWLGQILQVADQVYAQFGRAAAADPDGEAQDTAAATEPAGPQGQADPRSAGQRGPGRSPGGPAGAFGDPGFAEAQQAMERGDLDGAAAALEKILASSPGHPAATQGLAQVDLIRRVNSYDRVQAQRDAREHPDDIAAQARVADIDVAMGRPEEGFSRLLDAFRRASGDDRNEVRLHLLKLFEAFPPGDPRVTKARGQLSSLLF